MQSETFGACIRFDKDQGIYLHVNETHTAPYVTKIETDGSGFLVIHHGSPIADPACSSITVAGDETISGYLGIIAGGSGGVGRTRVRFYSTKHGRPLHLRNTADYDFIASSVSNIWVTWLHTTKLEGSAA